MSKLNVSRKTVSKWGNRWKASEGKLLAMDNKEKGIAYPRLIEDMLSDNPRSGAPCKFTAEQIFLIINVACESPENNDFPLSHWSLGMGTK